MTSQNSFIWDPFYLFLVIPYKFYKAIQSSYMLKPSSAQKQTDPHKYLYSAKIPTAIKSQQCIIQEI